ncbi:hypothetical protein GCM10010169_01990 [Micromonospora fulviviridis]|uniref:hypothetical protein n=1 Tax=Micromonospora fulviviridis TaxID=47860 RepID=UPI001667CF3D|nr:hypothetical protein [Micromonospora fulviviridis]GGR63062.1 hypothetical protein GCM10010169_01990 [Micromonospora fulviviridis]
MNIRRWSVGVLAAALFVPGLAACKTEADSPTADSKSTAPAVPADPKEALAASTKEIQQGNFSFAIKGGEFNGDGKVHMPSKSAEMKMSSGASAADDISMSMHLVFIDTDSWLKLDLDGAMADAIPGFKATKGKYQHLDRTRIKDAKELNFDFSDVDPAGSDKMIKAITDVKKTGEGSYEGTIDASKAADSDLLDAETVKALGTKATAVPFTAKLDAQGRLTEFAVQVPAAGAAEAQTVTVTYADYGTATAVQAPPAAQVVEAPASIYEMFKG